VELGSKGEAFLNEELPGILEYAFRKNIMTTLAHGVNLNDVSDEALEALVRFKTYRIRVSIDGATQETYRKYRVGGDLKRVFENIRKINALKKKHKSVKPYLRFQFIVFGHNEHEIPQAALLARMLNMDVHFKLNVDPEAFPVTNRPLIRQYIGYSDRREFFEKEGKEYSRATCLQLWKGPQINGDGRLLGCTRNTWRAFPGNVFHDDLLTSLNGEKMKYARNMIMGRVPHDEAIPCAECFLYKSMREHGNWITETEIRESLQKFSDFLDANQCAT
jgi:MoaA/NifB/PqqE/SkfB family radical SAM enzyme